MSIQSKSARILAVISVLALASACGEGAEGALAAAVVCTDGAGLVEGARSGLSL